MKKTILYLSLIVSHLLYSQVAELNNNSQAAISFLPENGDSIFHISHGLNNDLNISQGTNIGGVSIMTIKNIGNVGIGTTTPIEKLEVHGNIKLNGAGDKIYWDWSKRKIEQYSSDGTSQMIRFMNSMGPGNGNPDGGFDFTDHLGTSILRINNSNVGIGTIDTKGFKLGVQGKIAATEVKIATSDNWPDFVFDRNYNLPTLKEVEQHIKEKGHLKNIPNSEEVKKNGFFLGEMDSKLLQKIEELMLYTIAQQKEIESQKNEIKQLVEENKALKSLSNRLTKVEQLLNNKK